MKKTKDQLFWEFSLNLYAEPDVEQALLFLQNQHGFNVNMVLFCCWYGLEAQGKLAQKRLMFIDEGIKLWHDRIVKPLRRLRKVAPKKVNVLAVELNAEKAEQKMIVDRVGMYRHGSKSPPHKAADVCKSMLSYCRIKRIRLNDEGVDNIVTILTHVFPVVPEDEIANIVHEHFFEDSTTSGTVGTQLWLDL